MKYAASLFFAIYKKEEFGKTGDNMKESVLNHYFTVGKLLCLLALIVWQFISADTEIMLKACQGLYMVFFLVAAVAIEITGQGKMRNVILIAEGILFFLGVFLFPVSALFLGIFFLADLCVVCSLPPVYYLLPYVLVLPYGYYYGNYIRIVGMASFVVVVYFQEKLVVNKYRSLIGLEEETQSELKSSMEEQDIRHRKEMERSRLRFENEMLEERNSISQALHDKLGHSINGSLYQLEAAKYLVDMKPEECRRILQMVIDQLRVSMDEIRVFLRRKKPDKKRMAYLSLQSLCDECINKYGIKMNLHLEDTEGRITEEIWEIILDNTYEAVTNALKYADCKKMDIDIIAMNEVVRCTIHDDGKGVELIEDGMGLTGMKERVRMVNGFIAIESEVGFTINMILPLKRKKENS